MTRATDFGLPHDPEHALALAGIAVLAALQAKAIKSANPGPIDQLFLDDKSVYLKVAETARTDAFSR